jgi:hypothetical protein
MAHTDAVFFEGKVLANGDSLMITIPKPNADYLGICSGDYVKAKITKVRSRHAKD